MNEKTEDKSVELAQSLKLANEKLIEADVKIKELKKLYANAEDVKGTYFHQYSVS
jgi:hypothetical protein